MVPNLVPGSPPTLHVFLVSLIKHLIQIISSLLETPRPEIGVRQWMDAKYAVLGVSRNGVRSHGLGRYFLIHLLFHQTHTNRDRFEIDTDFTHLCLSISSALFVLLFVVQSVCVAVAFGAALSVVT